MTVQTNLTGVEAQTCSPDFLLLLEAKDPACQSISWFQTHREALNHALKRYGAVFFRGFAADSETFETIMDTILPEPYEMIDVVTPRSHVHGSLYTSTQAHPDLDIFQHQEMSYHNEPPYCLGFYCEVPSETGGLTPVNDLRALGRDARRLFPEVMDRFIDAGVLFVRNFNKYNFKSWQTCWESTTHEEAEKKLRAADTEWEWVEEDWLRTYQRRPAVLRDPLGGGEILYPSLNIFHRVFVTYISGPQNVPVAADEAEQSMVAYFGDRSRIPEDFLTWVRETTKERRVSVPWQARDFFLVNNLIAGHGRTAYTGPRVVHASFRGGIELGQYAITR